MTSNELPSGSFTSNLSVPRENGLAKSLSRSPHPYHRRSTSLQNAQKDLGLLKSRYSESSDSTESEERGTEADDEKGPILKGLPAPPLRGRKGLRGSKTPADLSPAASPFPTPPATSDRHSSYFATGKQRKGSKYDSGEQERTVEAYKKYLKKRRAEIARRCTEGALLVLIGFAACRSTLNARTLESLSQQLLASINLLTFLYTLYPLRIVLRRCQDGNSVYSAIRTGFHIPSVFDPGPLMYPIFLPFFISASLLSSSSDVLITNIILGLSSLPSKIIPDKHLHWIVSLGPIFGYASRSQETTLHHLTDRQHDIEQFTLLFPLHQATLMTLKYLTATSLDPAEIQLLSAGLINIFLFATFPQAEILKALLWVGALCLLVFCRKALAWEVKIARVPSWKFARNKSPKTGLLGICESLLKIILPQHPFKQTQTLGSDDEDYEHLKAARRRAKAQGRLRRAKPGGPISDLEPILADQDKALTQANQGTLQRSLTFSADGSYPGIPLARRKNSFNTQVGGLLSMTYTQAQACKWLISGYVFSVVLATILVVVRNYVSVRALSSHEPFGWAIGYMFGNIQPLRLWIVSNNLDAWISLPRHTVHNIVPEGSGWLEQMRQTQVGPANMRLAIAGYCVCVLTVGIGAVVHLGSVAEVDTRRKVFHGIMVAMLLPTIFVDPCFIALALSLILAVFLLLDLFRASQLPPISKPLTAFLAPYVDGRDHRGPVIVSPIFLLIGCAIPLWLSLAGASRTGEDPWLYWDTASRELSMVSGAVCVGMGDAAASLIGRRYGRTKWFWGGGKSLEGSIAFAAAVTVGLAASYAWLRVGGWAVWDTSALPTSLLKMMLAGSGASLLETVLTAGNDNVIVPIGLWLLTRGLQI